MKAVFCEYRRSANADRLRHGNNHENGKEFSKSNLRNRETSFGRLQVDDTNHYNGDPRPVDH